MSAFSTPSAFGSTGGSAFGGFSTANNNQSTPTPSLFGSTTNNQAAPSNNIFAAAANNNNNNNNNNANAAASGTQGTQPTTSIFGTAPAITTNTSDNNAPKPFFGSSTGTTGSIFGNASTNTAQSSTTPSLFGNTSTNSTQPATGSIFGATNTNAPTQPATGTSAFGTGTGSIFGSTNTGGSSIFGGGSTSIGGFGSTTAAAPSTSLFGTNTQTQQQQPQAPAAAASSLSQSALFGRPNATGLYASTLSVPHSLAPALGVSALGGGGLLKGRGMVVSAPGAPPDPAAQFAQLSAKIEGIQRAWDSRSPDCRFQYAFYNLVDPNQVNMYGRPSNATNDALWAKAVHENPDPSCLVPVIATGFDDLQARVDAQVQTAQLHQQKLADLKTRLTALRERHSLSNSPRHQRAAQNQMQLAYRISKLCSHLHLLIPALRASAIRPEEEALRAALDSLSLEIRGPGGGAGGVHHMGRLRARLNELWALLGAAQAAYERGKGKDSRWAVVDEDGLREIAQILGDQQAGLAHLTRLLQKDLRDLAVIEGTESRDPETGRVASPVSALASSMGRHAVR